MNLICCYYYDYHQQLNAGTFFFSVFCSVLYFRQTELYPPWPGELFGLKKEKKTPLRFFALVWQT